MTYVIIGLIIFFILYKLSKRNLRRLDAQIQEKTLLQGSVKSSSSRKRFVEEGQHENPGYRWGSDENQSSEDEDSNDFNFTFLGSGPQKSASKKIEYTNKRGNPCFLYRFSAFTDYTTESRFLKLDGTEKYFERIGGNSEAIMEPNNGYWVRVSEYDYELSDLSELMSTRDRYHYIGGRQVYIDFLLGIRAIYENTKLHAVEKQKLIKEYCNANQKAYLSDPGYRPPWEVLLVPTLTQAENIGEHKCNLLFDNAIRTINDIDNATDAQLGSIKGIGKATIGALRELALGWGFDRETPVIERDFQYRKRMSNQDKSTAP